jgi:hypothetical protein
MVGGQITELFDPWDHTLQTGRDVDYTVVIVAACLGVVFAAAKGLNTGISTVGHESRSIQRILGIRLQA